ncbi:MAG: alanyl-tRNA editing protein [Lachnospiraceae bacterium]|nr:alanyl-tRNA editing protein [Lachnospiraceae bacterium]
MRELFYEDAYLREFESVVLDCFKADDKEHEGLYAVELDKTAFYPEGGGQAADKGVINGIDVLDVQRLSEGVKGDSEELLGGRILHYIDRPLPVGETVSGKIDFDHRFDLMQNHTGEHIISGLIFEEYGFPNKGFHMGDSITIDVGGVLSWDQLMEIERRANERIYENLPVSASFPEDDELRSMEYRSKKELNGTVRIVSILKTDSCACCGLHVSRTGEVGIIKILSAVSYKGGTRCELLCGRRALLDYEGKTDRSHKIVELLSVEDRDIHLGVKRLLNESHEKSMRIAELTNKIFLLKASSYEDGGDFVIDEEEEMEGTALRRCCEELLKLNKGKICACLSVLGEEKDSIKYVIGSRSIDMRGLCRTLNAEFNGKGGGSAAMVQGGLKAPLERVKERLENLIAELLVK